jgi:hypothetical protein
VDVFSHAKHIEHLALHQRVAFAAAFCLEWYQTITAAQAPIASFSGQKILV